jgi:lipid-A-disaccharide synthase
MLVLFPFELAIYREHSIPASFVGHPLADRIAVNPDRAAARQRLGLVTDARIVAIMPGSRNSEIERMLTIQLQTACQCAERHPDLVFITSVLSAQTQAMVERIIRSMQSSVTLHIYQNRTDDVLAAADVALLTSGTITLEAMLHNLPMVVGYRVHWLTYQILRMLVRAKYAALPNLLADRPLVAEFLQYDCVPEAMSAALLPLLDNSQVRDELLASYAQIRHTLQQHAGAKAATAVLSLLEK